MTSIMYACEYCLHSSPESCGHFTPEELRVLPNGLWICDDCYECEDSIPEDAPDWGDLLPPPNYTQELKRLEATLRSIATSKEPQDNKHPDDADWRFLALEMKKAAENALSSQSSAQ